MRAPVRCDDAVRVRVAISQASFVLLNQLSGTTRRRFDTFEILDPSIPAREYANSESPNILSVSTQRDRPQIFEATGDNKNGDTLIQRIAGPHKPDDWEHSIHLEFVKVTKHTMSEVLMGDNAIASLRTLTSHVIKTMADNQKFALPRGATGHSASSTSGQESIHGISVESKLTLQPSPAGSPDNVDGEDCSNFPLALVAV